MDQTRYTLPIRRISTDQTGGFPITSNRGNKYAMILYKYYCNAILVEPMKLRTTSEISRAYKFLHTRLSARGLKQKFKRLDNEALEKLQQFTTLSDVDFQQVLPHVHRSNPTERAIRIFKNHFIAGLCGVDSSVPIHSWCRLLPQAEVILNRMRPSRLNYRLSAYTQLEGAFNYNKTPIAPPCTKSLVHETPTHRKSWVPNVVEVWYMGPVMQYYHCFRCYILPTNDERIAETVEFFPQFVTISSTSSHDATTKVANVLIFAVKHPTPASPTLVLCDPQLHTLEQLTGIFNSSTKQSPPLV